MRSGINRVEFYNNEYYDENFLDKLVEAASEVLGKFFFNISLRRICQTSLNHCMIM